MFRAKSFVHREIHDLIICPTAFEFFESISFVVFRSTLHFERPSDGV
jgi:hypothetical protein